MSDTSLSAVVLASVSKHHVLGIVGIAIGVVLVILGAMRVATHVAGAMLIPLIGLVVVVGGILLYTKVI